MCSINHAVRGCAAGKALPILFPKHIFKSTEQPSDHLDPDLGPAACLAVVFLTVLGTEALTVFDGVLQQLESSTDERHQSRLLI